jgi:hypothetical protein
MDCWKVGCLGAPPTPPDRESAARGRGAVRRRYPPDARKPRIGLSSSMVGGTAHQSAGDRQHLLLQALHPDWAQRPLPNEQPGQHRWSEESAERPGAPPTVH